MQRSIKVKCSKCKRGLYTTRKQLGIVPQKKVRMRDLFSKGCPICKASAHVCWIETVEEAKVRHRRDKKRMKRLKGLWMFIANTSNKN